MCARGEWEGGGVGGGLPVSSKPTCKARRKLLRHFQFPSAHAVEMWAACACPCVCVCVYRRIYITTKRIFVVFFLSFIPFLSTFEAAHEKRTHLQIFKHENGLANPQELSSVSETAQPSQRKTEEKEWERRRVCERKRVTASWQLDMRERENFNKTLS